MGSQRAFKVLLVAGLFAAFGAEARSLQGRLGVGYNGQFQNNQAMFQGVPGVSLKYHFTPDIGAALIAGLRTSNPGNSVLGLKLFKNVFYETNLNFYFFAAGAHLTANNDSGAEFMGGLGVEFFIPGIESLGFSVETGVTLSNITDKFILQTMGVSFLDAGIHFYF